MTRIEEMAKAAYEATGKFGHWKNAGQIAKATWIEGQRAAVSRLLEIEKASERWPDEHDDRVAYLQSLLDEAPQ